MLLTRPDIRLLADDLVFVDLERRALQPYLLPLRAASGTISLLAGYGLTVPADWRVKQFCCPPRELLWIDGPCTPSVLVVLGRSRSGTSVRPLEIVEALHLLLRRSDVLRFAGGVEVLQEMIAACAVRLELSVGRVSEGAAVLSALLDGASIADLPCVRAGAPGAGR
jgi:hypothetical protein